MAVFNLEAILKLNTSDFDSGLKAASGGVNTFADMLKANLVADAIGAAIRGIQAAGNALIDFGQNSISAATEYESAFTGVRKTVDATEEEFGELSDWILDASTRMASSAEEIAGTMEIAGQLGISGTEGLKTFTETMIMLGDTTNLNAEEAAGSLARFGNIAGLLPEDMDRIGSVIVDLGNHFATTESDIVQMATRLASAGTIAGLSSTDILALSTAMSSVGIKAEAGGTAMAQTLAKMSIAVDENGVELEKFATVAGMTAEEFATVWKGSPIDAVTAFINGLRNINEADESVIMTLEDLGLKGIRQTNMLQALALASDMMGNAVNMANTAFEENVALTNEANLRYGTVESRAKQTAEAFKNLQRAIGSELMPVYGELMTFTQTALQSMTAGFDEGGITGLVASMGSALSDGLAAVSEKLPDMLDLGAELLSILGQGIIDNIPTVVSAGTQIVVKVVEGLIKALPGLATGVVTLVKSLAQSLKDNAGTLLQSGKELLTLLWQGITEGLPMLAEGAISLMSSFAGYIQESLPTLLETGLTALMEFSGVLRENAGLLVDAALNLILTLAQGLISSLPVMIETIPTIITNIAGLINDNAPKLLGAGIQLIIMLVQGIIQAIPTLIEEFPKIIEAIFSVIQAVNWLSLGSSIITGIKNGILALSKSLPETLKNIGSTALEWLKAINWRTLGKDIIDLIIMGIKGLFTSIPNILKSIGTAAVDALKSIDWLSLGGAIVSGIASGLTNGITGAVDAISNLGSSMLGGLKNLLGIASPSKEFKKIGEFVTAGLTEGITKTASDAIDAAKAMSDGITGAINTDYDLNISGNTSSGVSTYPGGGVTINVYGAEGQDEDELANIIYEKLQKIYVRNEAVYA